MLNALVILLGYQLAGEILVLVLGIPIPGPVVGMLLLLLTLLARGAVPVSLDRTAQGILGHLSLLYVPAGVGVMVHAARIFDAWLPLIFTLVASTLFTLTVTALTMQLLLRHTRRSKVA